METIFDKINKTRFRIPFNLFILTVDIEPTNSTGKNEDVSPDQLPKENTGFSKQTEAEPVANVPVEPVDAKVDEPETVKTENVNSRSAFENFMNKQKE
jgi:hypothetical protein